MTVKNAVKKLNKIGKAVEIKRVDDSISGYFSEVKTADGQDYTIGFCVNGIYSEDADIVCIYTKRVDLEIDSMTDYFPQTHHKTLSAATRHLSLI
jgi:hypothetical protein